MSISTQSVLTNKSGTSFTVDVTNLNLSDDLTEKDFVVINLSENEILSNANFTKTNQTTLTYSGPDVGTNISLELRRDSPVARYQEVSFSNRFDSSVYNTEINRILKKLYELDLYGGTTGNLSGGGSNPENMVYLKTAALLNTTDNFITNFQVERDFSLQWDATENAILIKSSGVYLASFNGAVDRTGGTGSLAVELKDKNDGAFFVVMLNKDIVSGEIVSPTVPVSLAAGQLIRPEFTVTGSGNYTFANPCRFSITPISGIETE